MAHRHIQNVYQMYVNAPMAWVQLVHYAYLMDLKAVQVVMLDIYL